MTKIPNTQHDVIVIGAGAAADPATGLIAVDAAVRWATNNLNGFFRSTYQHQTNKKEQHHVNY